MWNVSNRNRKTNPLFDSAAVQIAREALEELGDGEIGRHTGMATMSSNVVVHRFDAHVPGYAGWEWQAVIAFATGSDEVTVNEVALVPAEEALRAPDWVPWSERVMPGDLGPGDVLPPEPDDPRLADGELTDRGLEEAKQRWRTGEYGPNSEMAAQAVLQCRTCAFFLKWEESFGICANEYSADGKVVHARYGCGAHSETQPAEPVAQPEDKPYDDEGPMQ